MWCVTSWVCKCGAHVKVMYETDGITIIICPKPPCALTYPVSGTVTNLWLQDSDVWRPVNIAAFVLPAA